MYSMYFKNILVEIGFTCLVPEAMHRDSLSPFSYDTAWLVFLHVRLVLKKLGNEKRTFNALKKTYRRITFSGLAAFIAICLLAYSLITKKMTSSPIRNKIIIIMYAIQL